MLRYLLLCFLVLLQLNCKQPTKRPNPEPEDHDLTTYVNPFLGTAPLTDPGFIGYNPPKGWRVWAGLTYPGATLPNAMVQLSPITAFGTGAGYEYEAGKIIGFAHTNKGHWNLCNLPVLPISGGAKAPYISSFSHDREIASPDYYEVYLEDYKVKVRLTATLRAAFHEYIYAENADKKLLFKLGKSNNHVSNWEIKKENGSEISGFQQVGRDKVHFYAKLNQKIQGVQLEKQGKSDGYVLIELGNSKNDTLQLKMGISYVSTQNAKENLEKEIGEKTFEEIHKRGKGEWNNLLSKIQVNGGSEKQKELFYSSLYRSVQWPTLRSDVNGEFTNDKGEVQKAGYRYYTLPSLWDTYRNKVVLLGLLRPKVTADVISSMINKGEISGFMPTFFHGDHAASFIAGSYLMGITNFDVNMAYQLLLNNAYKEGGTRPYISEYIQKGYIPDPVVNNPNTETKAKAGVSKTLEFAYDDYSLAQLAKALGDSVNYRDLMARSQNYKNVFDKKTKFMRGRLENGDWIAPFNPQYPYYEYMYREANAWQVSFYAPHDMPGLVKLYGGKEAFERKLDSLFTVPWDPNHIARNISSFIGQYCQGNQPDHEAPFSYYFVNKPKKSQAILDTIMNTYYGVGENGLALPGMDDAGEMSAWYVFTAVGLYPLSPADNKYLISVPLFDEVTWALGTGKKLSISNPNGGRELTNIKLNGKRLKGYFVPQDVFKAGGKIEVETQK